MSKIKIQQTRSRIGRPKDQKRTLDALGLKKMNQVVEHNLTPQIQGMLNKINHLITSLFDHLIIMVMILPRQIQVMFLLLIMKAIYTSRNHLTEVIFLS